MTQGFSCAMLEKVVFYLGDRNIQGKTQKGMDLIIG